ncbi:MAG: hypothetical protein QNK23_00180 [Crocinitomicaceae bacterium]|nr:hypothetical protein [Crocinitomicaceae bacterium]
MISNGLGIALAVIAGIGTIALFAWLWKIMKKKPVAGGTIGFFIACIVVTGIVVVPSNVYVINEGKDYTHYWVYSSDTQYERSNGESVEITIRQTQCMIINDTQDDYALESVIYGFGFADDKKIGAMSAIVLSRSKIDYFFDEEPPETISTESSASAVTRTWLRTEADYGGLEYLNEDASNLENLQDLLHDAMED